MPRRIAKVSSMFHGHLMLEFEDGSKQTVFRGDHEIHKPDVGDFWPPDGHEHVSGVVQNNALQPAPQKASLASLEPAGAIEGAGAD